MNFGKGAQLILAIGIFVVGAIFLYRMNSERQAEGDRIDIQVETAQELLPQLTAEREDYESQLASLKAELESVQITAEQSKLAFPESIESIEYDEIIFQMAHDRDLEIVYLTATETSSKSISDITLTTTGFQVKVEGKSITTNFESLSIYREFIYQTVSDILDFINGIAVDDNFISATLDSVDISVPGPITEEDITEMQEAEEPDEIDVPNAVIQVTIYSYEGN